MGEDGWRKRGVDNKSLPMFLRVIFSVHYEPKVWTHQLNCKIKVMFSIKSKKSNHIITRIESNQIVSSHVIF